MPSKCTFDRNGDLLTINRPDRNEIAFTTYREDYWDELSGQSWRLNENGYPTCSKLGDLHRYIMGKWYGEDVLEELTKKGYVVDHLDNKHNNCRIDNLEFLLKDFNTAKAQWLDKQIKELQHHYALALYKDFETKCYQITIGMNDPIVRKDGMGDHYVGSVKFLYTEDYPVVIKDAEMMLLHLERDEFNPRKYNACSIREYDCPNIKFTEEEKNAGVVTRNGRVFLVLGTGHSLLNKIAPDRGWYPTGKGTVQYQVYIPSV